jgi:L-ascorbate metabolism protein UlaG (beta-lactamase superfamily)
MGMKRRLSPGFALLLLCVLTVGLTWGLEGGELPRAPRLHGTFRNLDPDFWSASNWTRVRFYLLGLSAIVKLEHAYAPLPTAVPDVGALTKNRHDPTVTWVGHSTLLVQLDGVNILTDPTWSLRVGPWSGRLGVRRFTPPGIAFDDLPPIDLVLISHDHYDHLDEATVRRLARAFNPRFVVPLGIKAWLAERGITNVSELDWSESITVKGLRIVCTPAQHGSGRVLLDAGQRLWASWVVVGSKRFYFGGDSGYAPHLAMIGEAFGPFDLAALPIGSYTPREIARPVHMSPEEALQASLDLRSARFIGIHWGTFELAQEAYEEPPRRIAAEVARLELDPRSILLPKPGETSGW